MTPRETPGVARRSETPHLDVVPAAHVAPPLETPAAALARVAEAYGVQVEAIQGCARGTYICKARRAACVELARLGLSASETGAVLGGRDHSTVIYYLRRTEA